MFEKTKINEKEAGVGPFKKKKRHANWAVVEVKWSACVPSTLTIRV